MSCAKRRDRLYDRLYGLLDEGDAAELDRHLASCPDCRLERDALKSRDALLDAWTPAYRPLAPVRIGVPRRPAALAWAAAALLVTLGTTIVFPSSSSYDIEGAPLAPGQKVKTQVGASVRLGRAGRLELEPGTEVLYRRGGPDLDHELELAVGTLHVDVYPTGRAFRILIGERTVEVRGTRFTVRRFGAEDLAQILGEDSMKRWNLASASVALVAVTSGTVALSGPDGRQPVEAGRAVLATPAGVEPVEAGESFASVRQVRDGLLRSLAAREEKIRATRAGLEALQSKSRQGQLPPGATLESLMAGLRAAVTKGGPEEIQEASSLLGLFLAKDEHATSGVLAALREARDAALAQALCSALWLGGRVQAHLPEVLKLFADSDIPVDVRSVILQNLEGAFFGRSMISEADATLLLRAAKAVGGSGQDHVTIRAILANLAVQQISVPSEAWEEFKRFLSSETEDGIRSSVLRNFFHGSSRRKDAAPVEGLMLDALRGRYGAVAMADLLGDPLLPWFNAGNADAFVGSLRQAAAQVGDASQRQAVAGQLGLLYLIHQNAGALDAIRQLQATETVDAVRSRLADVIQAAEKGTLDLDKLMEKLQLQWNF
ncbi:MAG TPA: zf-HC2 domain-containing protein [Planctomycetota bacterium]|jgi:hypothetical protein|nr:zf-HC2 domain-containing protein [Planctomycetota bacterium]